LYGILYQKCPALARVRGKIHKIYPGAWEYLWMKENSYFALDNVYLCGYNV
jgi:hypothetical protein